MVKVKESKSGRLYTRLREQERDLLFELYCQKPTVDHVVQEGKKLGYRGANPTTVNRWKERDQWNKRLDAVREKARTKIEDSIADERARMINQGRGILQAAFEDLVEVVELPDGRKVPRMKDKRPCPKCGHNIGRPITPRDWVQVAKMLLLLHGDPTERIDMQVNSIVEQVMGGMSDAVMRHVRSPAEREAVKADFMVTIGRAHRQLPEKSEP